MALVLLGLISTRLASAETIIIDPEGVATEDAFKALLKKHGLEQKGFVNWYTMRWPTISLIGGMSMGNNSEDLQFFYEKPFRWYTPNLDYVMEGGGKKFGVRAAIHPYYKGGPKGNRSYLLTYRCDSLLNDYHPSYILANGHRIWDSKVHHWQKGKIIVPFFVEEAEDPVLDFVVDLDYTPEVKGLAFRGAFVGNLGAPGQRIELKGVSSSKEASPADTLERFAFGLFPSGYDFWTEQGPKIEDLKKNWKPNFRPDYPVDDLRLSPVIVGGTGKGPYAEFMCTYGGCNILGENFDPELLKAASGSVRGAMVKTKDVENSKKVLAMSPALEVNWFDEVEGLWVTHASDTDSERSGRIEKIRKEIEKAKHDSGAPERVHYMTEPFCPALTAVHEYERGADILVLKNEEDPQSNILMSMSRGAGRSVGKPYGFYWEQTHYPFPSIDQKLQTCLLYYLSGGTWIGAELENAPSFGKGVVADWVFPYVQALRFAMVHPARGTPIVPNGIIYTYGDRWWVPYTCFGQMDTFQRYIEYDHATKSLKCEPKLDKVFPWMPKDQAQWNFGNSGHLNYFYGFGKELHGYDVLDVFFPGYGDAYSARITRLLTGTPHGPLDFVAIDKASEATLKTYGLLACLGHLSMTPEIEKKLLSVAESGVPVVLGAQHFKSGDSFQPAFGLTIQGPPAVLGGTLSWAEHSFKIHGKGSFAAGAYSAKGDGWETVMKTAETNSPLVVRRSVGKGTIYVYLGEWISEGGDVLRPLLETLATRSAPLRFAPADDQLEYVAYRKGAGAWVALFNHGAIPIGCDRLKEARATPPEPLVSKVKGPWKGEIDFRLEPMGLDPKGEFALYAVEGIDGQAFDDVISGNKGFKVSEIPSVSKDGALHATVELNKRAEYVIAPKGQGEAVFFGKP
jgi:hypothetical protein